ncbi:double-strand break repair protein AddB [Epibacterium sp. SM1979]|uniref:Double-strand break repair protein AddB n=1 Tax=Tritonibacter litoralis TaxID=2662264 RepID=A0A843YB33_9RHOB|nr:double-strand break repair protein AddB [Tritonibacter litoralis]MQQ08191.1 double-strand break repair protein AddB [Tritonibacter litoralis]
MFKDTTTPRLFGVPCGVDFPKALVNGLLTRSTGLPPDALARCEVILNTTRMTRRVRQLFDAGPAVLLPRLTLLGGLTAGSPLPPAIPALRRRLELTQLVSKLLDTQPDLASRASLYDLADSLAGLMDEMQGEGVSTDVIRDLDVTDQSGHWARAQSFIGIADQLVALHDDAMDKEARQRQLVTDLIARWQDTPPQHPIILAGSTGSRGTTLMLMKAIAQLPQGAVILPGFDFDQPDAVWAELDNPLTSEDHPQYRFHKILRDLEMSSGDVTPWSSDQPAAPARNRLISLALRPAPVTDAWMREGPKLQDLGTATEHLTLVEADGPRAEALAIALRLRQAAEDGQTAALITPDRMLTRQVASALDQWDILPDDSAGVPLQLTPPGRFLRHVARLFSRTLTSDQLLTLLKHPLTHSGAERGKHLLHTRDLELHIRRNGPPFPDGASFTRFGTARDLTPGWIDWLSHCFDAQVVAHTLPLSDWMIRLRILAETIAAGPQAPDASGGLWDQKAGREALRIVEELEGEAHHGGDLSARDFGDLLGALLSQDEVRDRDAPYGSIMIWGTLEARVQGADLLILGGLNEGSWPEAASPDPWLNRQMRSQAGLLLPERRIGLAAHDFQQAIAGAEVWLTRAKRTDEADTVPSRWLNRMTNLLSGLPEQQGPAQLDAMRRRGQTWLDWARALEKPTPIAPAGRPSPRPPVSARPRKLSVTEIPRLIRDPYAIYAKHVLRLKPLNPLVQEPDALLRGIVLHRVFELFVKQTLADDTALSPEVLIETALKELEAHVPWPVARSLWMSRIRRIARAFVEGEQNRQQRATPALFEGEGHARLDPLDFTLTCRADRIDRDARGMLHLFDYKTGAPPTVAMQKKFDKQLLIEAALVEQGGFEALGPGEVQSAAFLGLGNTLKEVTAPLDSDPPDQVWDELKELISAYFDPNQGYSSRSMMHKDDQLGDYDHLARYGEWDRSTDPTPEDLL